MSLLNAAVRSVEAGARSLGRFFLGFFAPSTDSVVNARRLGRIFVALALLIPGTVFVWSLWVSRLWEKPVLERLAYANERSMGVEIVDSSDRYLGMIHYKADPKFDYVEPHDIENASPQMQATIDAYEIRPDHKTIHVSQAETPPYFWKCLVYLEDRAMGTWRNPAGIDFWTAFKIPLNGDGGSTIPMMISRHMRKTLPDQNEPVQSKIWRKLKEWQEAPAIWRELGEPNRQAGLKAWSAQHVALVTNLGGAAQDIIPDVYGVQTAGRLLFGSTIEKLTPAQQMMLAAAYRRPLIPYRAVTSTSDDPAVQAAALRAERAKTRWADVADRALACVDAKSGIVPAAERQAIAHDIDALKASPPPVALDSQLLAGAAVLFQPDRIDQLAMRLEHPYSRLRIVLPRPHRRFVVDLLTDRFGRNWRDQVRRLELTLDMPADLRFQRTMDEAWGKFETVNDNGWLLAPASADSMGYVVAVADDRGHIVRFFEGGAPRQDTDGVSIPRFEGGSARYPGALPAVAVDDIPRACPAGVKKSKAPCPYAPRTEAFPRQGRDLASVGKVLASIALADSGATPTAGVVNAFAKSDNVAIEKALSSIGTGRLRQIMAALDIRAPDGETPLPVAVSRGFVRASPREAHRMMSLALAMARNKFDEPVYLPTMIERYDQFDTATMKASTRSSPDDLDSPIVPAALFSGEGGPSNEAMSRFVRETLSAPICKGGTLKSLSKWCPGQPRGVQLHIAKSGTRANASGETVDIWIAGGVVLRDGRAFTYVVLAGTGQPSLPFHSGTLNASSAAGLVDALLNDLAAEPAPAAFMPPMTYARKPTQKTSAR
ncbi:MAG: transglycosylase domain-containing protein [Hyphomonadaceae bacterium]|nr:transglycosylase domain-containing protein [Hyphomonadaceae bacterium]